MDSVMIDWFSNHYSCEQCRHSWDDEWSCMCDDRFPLCFSEVTPSYSADLSRPLVHQDFLSAARFLPSPLFPPQVAAWVQSRLER